ncbi:hypothetical protein LTR62_008586 [Meristemomyces frigidus]|uniref:Heterokaryon incompatibility domain-containing protein n=1 Tax=Meristemomyces frigidus TaxID=1508187 RepID=A0AAN7TM03_9PEZI|nr:hypothetical protein LTR62_008586 [Meristemomyces frigidus]
MGNLPPYTYDERLQGGELRVLTVMAGVFGTPLVCSLDRARVLSAKPFDALSYVWGDRSNTVELQIDGKALVVTTSVCEALQHLRSPQELLHIWIDQVCINQDDIEERNAQVQQMHTIYQRAECTYIWFGPAQPRLESALQIVLQICGGA